MVPEDETATIVERAAGRLGELALRSVGGHYEIVVNGMFLMDTRNGCSERLLVSRALRDAPERAHVLVGGLGVGFSLAEALRSDRVGRVTLVEIEPTIVAWGRTLLAPFSGDGLADLRVEVVIGDLVEFLGRPGDLFDAICLDVDNGPTWTVVDANGALYADEGLALLRDRLAPGGTLAVWSAAAAPAFERRLRAVFDAVETVSVPVARGEPDVVTFARRAATGARAANGRPRPLPRSRPRIHDASSRR